MTPSGNSEYLELRLPFHENSSHYDWTKQCVMYGGVWMVRPRLHVQVHRHPTVLTSVSVGIFYGRCAGRVTVSGVSRLPIKHLHHHPLAPPPDTHGDFSVQRKHFFFYRHLSAHDLQCNPIYTCPLKHHCAKCIVRLSLYFDKT